MNSFSRLLPVAGCAYALAAVFVPAANEKFYDLGGALGFLSTTFVSLYYPTIKAKFWDGIGRNVQWPPLSSFAPRQLLLSAALGIWTIRLGSFLAQRALKAGGDSRFDEVKHQPAKFTTFWMVQATWILLVGLPVYMVCLHFPAGFSAILNWWATIRRLLRSTPFRLPFILLLDHETI
ncbi:hypothetical protein EWM64_g3355 [Hericium alpestre]|uniref:Uncharacterized protein n=1 Tax=Hericium alpestre TaxID=135208 RepID=A0A4Z0A2J3_9AGAM|nr:hypothetical protein EWM64_g3355 [Hericium alpestre]